MSKASRCLDKFVFSGHDTVVTRKDEYFPKKYLRWAQILFGEKARPHCFNANVTAFKKLLSNVHFARHYWENRATSGASSRIWQVLPNMGFPPIWGEKWRQSEHAHASYPGLFFSPARVQPLWWVDRKGEFRNWTSGQHVQNTQWRRTHHSRPQSHDPSDLRKGSRALVRPDFLSMCRVFVSYSQPIRFARFDGKSVNRGLPVVDKVRALDPCRRSEWSWLWGRECELI